MKCLFSKDRAWQCQWCNSSRATMRSVLSHEIACPEKDRLARLARQVLQQIIQRDNGTRRCLLCGSRVFRRERMFHMDSCALAAYRTGVKAVKRAILR